MRKVVFKTERKVVLEQYDPGKLAPGFIRVRHLYSQLSAGTEMNMLTGKQGPVKDIVPGYSGVGEVIEGWEGTSFKKGDIVMTGEKHKDIIDIPHDWAAQTFCPVSRKFAKESTFLQLGKVALHGLHRVNFKLGDWIAVFGLGIVGQLSAQLASLNSGGRVIGIDVSAARRKTAEKTGIRTVDPSSPSYIEAVKEITGGGADIVLETSGNGKALADSLKVAGYGGQVALVGGQTEPRELDMMHEVQFNELAIVGARRCDMAVPTPYDKWTVMRYMQEFQNFIEAGKLQIDPLISHLAKPEQAPEIYEKLLKRDESVVGVVFDWTAS